MTMHRLLISEAPYLSTCMRSFLLFRASLKVAYSGVYRCLEKADDINIWRYKGLTINFVHYILRTFVDMLRKQSGPI